VELIEMDVELLAQGLAQALYEEVVYDAHGQLVTGSLMDYAVPKASMLPTIETSRTVTPTLLNPLGAKGIGEAGTIGSRQRWPMPSSMP
jgi:carbon-monoxide dehydrogenase large subunit